MANKLLDHEGARTIRTHWFRYLDTIEPLRGELFGYCHKLTHNIWDAEDLVQDTLLTGFGMTARGDFHGETSPVRNIKAYLFRTATNAWLDVQRKHARQLANAEEQIDSKQDPDPTTTMDAISKAVAGTSPQEFVAILLKDVYDFTLEEVADFIGTTEGTVKSALSRARRKMREKQDKPVIDPTAKELVLKFVDAINSQDIDQVIELMAEKVQVKVCNVGGGRGREGIWTRKSMVSVRATYAECDGVPVVLMFNREDENLTDVLRLEGSDNIVTRIIDHCYAPETMRHVAESLGYQCNATAYHQPWKIIETGMVPTTFLPWQD
jgi:RNA polymerase sigma-70 factor (ECF subfamily)